jgi:Flp pilus assembly protein TadG
MLRLRGCKISFLASPVTGRRESTTHRRGIFPGEAGQSAVEFALIFAALFSLLFGILELCLAGYTYHYVSEAAREGTRYALVRGSACTGMPDCNATAAQIGTYVKGRGYPGINAPIYMTVTTYWLSPTAGSPPTWSSCSTSPCNIPGNMVQVTVLYAYPLGIPFWGSRTINMSSTSQMVISQ